jgi:hypothetical protein
MNILIASFLPLSIVFRAFSLSCQVTGHALPYEPIGGSAACSEIVSEAFTSLNALVLGTAPTWGTDDAIPQALRPCNAMANELDLSTYEVQQLHVCIYSCSCFKRWAR